MITGFHAAFGITCEAQVMFGGQPMTVPSVRSGFMIFTVSNLVPEVQYGMAVHKGLEYQC